VQVWSLKDVLCVGLVLYLCSISLSCDLFMQYEPELFPGLIYRMKQPKIVLLIFVSGKIVITGAKVNPKISCFIICDLHTDGVWLLILLFVWHFRWERRHTQPLKIYTLSLQSSGKSSNGIPLNLCALLHIWSFNSYDA
jgi:hypothetical protein